MIRNYVFANNAKFYVPVIYLRMMCFTSEMYIYIIFKKLIKIKWMFEWVISVRFSFIQKPIMNRLIFLCQRIKKYVSKLMRVLYVLWQNRT